MKPNSDPFAPALSGGADPCEYRLNDEDNVCWIEVNDLVICIRRTTTGAQISVYDIGAEMEPPITGCEVHPTYACEGSN